MRADRRRGREFLRRRVHPDGGVLNIAHRGARAFAPENTLSAFAKARAIGCEWMELDVRLSRDGVPIVFHDENLTQKTDALARFPGRSSYDVASFAYHELAQLDAGSWFVRQLRLEPAGRASWLHGLDDSERSGHVTAEDLNRYESGAIRIPSLAEILAFAYDSGLSLNLELKPAPEASGIVGTVLDRVGATGMTDRVLISSFDHRLLYQLRRATKDVAVGVLTDTPLADPAEYVADLDADVYLPACYAGEDGARKLQYAHIAATAAQGVAVIPWTCNDAGDIRQLLNAGVRGIISDFPNRVRDALENAE